MPKVITTRMDKVQTLAEYLGTDVAPPLDPSPRLEDITNAKQFAEAVLTSREFRLYIINSLTLGSLPAAITCRMMDYAWGKPIDRVEHAGIDGAPIEIITRIVRVIVDPSGHEKEDEVVH